MVLFIILVFNVVSVFLSSRQQQFTAFFSNRYVTLLCRTICDGTDHKQPDLLQKKKTHNDSCIKRTRIHQACDCEQNLTVCDLTCAQNSLLLSSNNKTNYINWPRPPKRTWTSTL